MKLVVLAGELCLKKIGISMIIVAIVCALNVSCGNANLTREGASKIIQSSEKLTNLKKGLYVHQGAFKKGIKMGLWDNRSILTDKGKMHFLSVPKFSYITDRASATLAIPVEMSIEVTGILDEPQSGNKIKLAEFIWNYENLSNVVKRFAVSGGNGAARFILYDDGWRLSDIKLSVNREPFNLTQKEKDEEKSDIESYQKLKAEKERAEEERIRKAKDERDKLIKKASTPTKILGSYKFINGPKKSTGIIQLTDVDASYVYIMYKKEWNVNIWFGNIKNIRSVREDRILFELYKSIIYAPGKSVKYIQFREKRLRDSFYDNIIKAKSDWDKNFPTLAN